MHGTPEQQELIHKIVDTIVREYRPEAVILFGSSAWGEPNEDSDIDLLIIKDDPRPQRKRGAEILMMLYQFMPEADPEPIVLTPFELEHAIDEDDQFIEEIIMQGETIYATEKAKIPALV